MKVVSVINYKGGVGKTSLTTNLGAELAWRGKKVLLLDLDAQASLTFSFISPDDWRDNYENEGTIKSWFESFENGLECLAVLRAEGLERRDERLLGLREPSDDLGLLEEVAQHVELEALV